MKVHILAIGKCKKNSPEAMLIAEYVCNGWAGGFYLNAALIPLKKRYNQGERTKELYDFIMSCK